MSAQIERMIVNDELMAQTLDQLASVSGEQLKGICLAFERAANQPGSMERIAAFVAHSEDADGGKQMGIKSHGATQILGHAMSSMPAAHRPVFALWVATTILQIAAFHAALADVEAMPGAGPLV